MLSRCEPSPDDLNVSFIDYIFICTNGGQLRPCHALHLDQVKRAMLDSANDTIEQLKAELADMQVIPSR